MATTTMGLGKFSGKVGGVVFAVSAGQQIARAYQPIVNNPKSNAQKLQRAKGNLVGQVSKITPWQILEGLGNSKRNRRARFLRILMQRTTSSYSTSNPNTITAKLANTDYIFSEGSVMPTIGVQSAIAAINTINVTVNRLGGIITEEWESSGALVVVVIKDVNGMYEHVLYRFVQAEEITEPLLLTFYHISEGNYYADVYVAPFRTDDGSSLRSRAESIFGTQSDFNANMMYNPAQIPLQWGQSVLSTTATYQAG